VNIIRTVTQDLGDIAEKQINKLNNDILYWQSNPLMVPKNGDLDTCNEALERQENDIKCLIALVKTSQRI
jgi:hypothetical protein